MSQREKQPRLVRFTLHQDNYEAFVAEVARRGLTGDDAAPRVILNEWIRNGRGAPAAAPPPPAASAVQVAPPPPAEEEDDPDDAWAGGLLIEGREP